jgi:hypothetical protein
MTIDERIRYTLAKLRNIIYYRLEVEPTIEYRFRAQYMHVLRNYRKEVVGIIRDMEETDTRKEYLLGIVRLIDPKIKTNECLSTIQDLKEYVEK